MRSPPRRGAASDFPQTLQTHQQRGAALWKIRNHGGSLLSHAGCLGNGQVKLSMRCLVQYRNKSRCFSPLKQAPASPLFSAAGNTLGSGRDAKGAVILVGQVFALCVVPFRTCLGLCALLRRKRSVVIDFSRLASPVGENTLRQEQVSRRADMPLLSGRVSAVGKRSLQSCAFF